MKYIPVFVSITCISCKWRHFHIQSKPVFPQMFSSYTLKSQHHFTNMHKISSHIFRQAANSRSFHCKMILTFFTGHVYSILRVSSGPSSGWCYKGCPLQVCGVNCFVHGSPSFHAFYIFVNHILKDAGRQSFNFTSCTVRAHANCFQAYALFCIMFYICFLWCPDCI